MKRKTYMQPRASVMVISTEWVLVASRQRYNGEINELPGEPVGGRVEIGYGGEGNPDDIDAKQGDTWDGWE